MTGINMLVGGALGLCAVLVLVMTAIWSVDASKGIYIKQGFLEQDGKYYSVKPATLRTEP